MDERGSAEGDPVFGAAALRLAPRSLPELRAGGDPRSAPWDPERARVAFATAAVRPAERAALSALPGARLTPRDDEETLLECPTAELARLARELGAADLLLRAHALATRPLAPPALLAVLNATPDSFSDGGRFLDPERAAEAAAGMVAAGAAAIDVGGESTRPGSEPVTAQVELERVVPVIEAVRARGVEAPISIDTRRSAVAAAALDAGATSVNDVSAGRDDPEMLALVADRGCAFVAMHMRGRPADMQRAPRYADPVREITAFLRERGAACLRAGIALPNIVLDPGIGFGKRLQDNVALIRRLVELRSLGRPLAIGASRKSYLGRIAGEGAPERRAGATAAAVALAAANGAEVLRVHDVAICAQAVAVGAAHAGRLPGEAERGGAR